MTSRTRVVFLLIFAANLVLTSCGPGTGSHGLKAWYVDSLVKVFPGDAVGASQLAPAEFMAARNQHVNIQVALRSTNAFSAITATHLSRRKTTAATPSRPRMQAFVRSATWWSAPTHRDRPPMN